jgi:uncharacterized FAD-dependent dehydrogenase
LKTIYGRGIVEAGISGIIAAQGIAKNISIPV